VATVQDLEFPDDFPAGKYYLLVTSLAKEYPVPALKVELMVNAKGTALAKNTKSSD
jgi:hypothetical protein